MCNEPDPMLDRRGAEYPAEGYCKSAHEVLGDYGQRKSYDTVAEQREKL